MPSVKMKPRAYRARARRASDGPVHTRRKIIEGVGSGRDRGANLNCSNPTNNHQGWRKTVTTLIRLSSGHRDRSLERTMALVPSLLARKRADTLSQSSWDSSPNKIRRAGMP